MAWRGRKEIMEFIDIWNLLAPQGEYKRRKRACTKLWQSYDPAQQQRIYDAISKAKGNGEAVNNNPYFAIEDAALALPRRQPEFLRGDAESDEDLINRMKGG